MTNKKNGQLSRKLSLLVAIPCLNEAATITHVIEQIPKAIQGVDFIDVVIIDDGSSDNTSKLAVEAGATVISHTYNKGVGAAFHTAINYAVKNKYDLMVNMDGDRQFNPDDIQKLVQPIIMGEADMVTASRFLSSMKIENMPKIKLIGNKMMSYLISKLVGQKFSDVSCGFRAYSREALMHLNLHGQFTYTQETFLQFIAHNLKIKELAIDVTYFPDRKSRVVKSIKQYAASTLKIISRSFRDYFPLKFFWGISIIFVVPSMLLGAIFFLHYLSTGHFKGFLSFGFISAFLFLLAVVFFVLGIVTDMLDRIRTNQDRILYLLKQNFYNLD